MKVLIANYRYFVSSGPERYLFNIAEQLEARGHTVVPFSVKYEQNVETPYERYFVPPIAGEDEVYFHEHKKTVGSTVRTASRLFYSPSVRSAVSELAGDVQPDIAYVLYYLRKLSPSLLVGLKRHGLPIVARISDYGMFCADLHCLRDGQPCTLCVHGDVRHSIKHRCVKGSLALSSAEAAARMFHRARGYFDLIDRFVVTNPFMLEMMVEAGYDRSRIVCIPTFTDVEKFSPAPRPAGSDYLLCVGRLDSPKGIHVLLDALALVRSRGIALPLLKIAGAGHDREYVAGLERQIVDLGLADQVELLGHVSADAIPELLRGALCTVLPALWFENLPNTLIESLACGTPAIVSDIGSLPGEIESGVNGLLARPGDAADLADKIAVMLTDVPGRDRMARGARESAMRRYAPAAHTDRLLELFDSLVPVQQR